MSKTLTSPQSDSYNATTQSICRMFHITRTDGIEYFFTSLDKDVSLEGDTYLSAVGFSATAYQSSTGLSVDNAEISALTGAAGLTEDEIIAGRLDGARWEVFEYDHIAALRLATIGAGVLGEYRHSDPSLFLELRSKAQFINGSVGHIIQKRCRHELFDSICRVNEAANTFTGTITTATSRLVFVVSNPPARALGKVTFTSGSNTGVTRNVQAVSGSTITVELSLPFDLQIGDGYSITNGCNKLRSQCRDDYDNIANFGGAPDMPGNDALRAPPLPR